MSIEFKLISNKEELIRYEEEIISLFKICYNSDLDRTVWDWAYIQNPMGDPLVSLCFSEGRLVGHYAVVPHNLIRKERLLHAFLSMTTMVDPSYRKFGLFVEQAQQVYGLAKKEGVDLVFGFPNAKSTPGFRKRLNWILDAPDFVAAVTLKELSSSSSFKEILHDQDMVRVDRCDEEYLEWRLSKPGAGYCDAGAIITKRYQAMEDIVFCERIDLKDDGDTERYNILLDASVEDLKPKQVFEYQFGYLPLTSRALDLRFKKDLILSDVF